MDRGQVAALTCICRTDWAARGAAQVQVDAARWAAREALPADLAAMLWLLGTRADRRAARQAMQRSRR